MDFYAHFFEIILSPIQGHSWFFWLGVFYLVSLALRETEAQTLKVSKLFIIPVGLLIMKLHLLSSENFSILMDYLFWFLLGGIVGYYSIMGQVVNVEVFKDIRLLKLPASFRSIKVLIAFFLSQYGLGILAEVYPGFALGYLMLDHLLGFLCSGYFLGVALCYQRKVKKYNPPLSFV